MIVSRRPWVGDALSSLSMSPGLSNIIRDWAKPSMFGVKLGAQDAKQANCLAK